MKIQSLLVIALFCFTLGNASAQEKDLKVNANQVTENSSNIERLLNSKSFEFIANTAFPTGGTPKNLVGSGYSVTFSPEKIVSNLPFYGRAYSGMASGPDKGMRFQGKPENFTIAKNKEYQVNTIVNENGNTYGITLSVSDSGYASLSISSNARGTINFQGEILPYRKD
ncbi:DUF4251 domain-containing protein [Aequorivita todarodis]|nr:DUF4251 domain-containing protein [Aequorivita todarodis]